MQITTRVAWVAVILAASAYIGSQIASAQGGTSSDGRYSMSTKGDGSSVWRLDTATGELVYCYESTIAATIATTCARAVIK